MPIPAILFILLFFAACIAALRRDASWAIFMYVGVYFLDPMRQWWGYALPGLPWMLMISLVCIASYGLRYKKYIANALKDAPAFKSILWFSAVVLAVTPLALWEARQALVLDKVWKMLVILFVMYKVIDSRRKLELLFWCYLAGMYYIADLARSRGRGSGGRLEGIGTIDSTDANDLGSIFVAGIPLLVFYIMEGKNWIVRLLAAWFLAFGLNALILLNSRGAFIGLLGAICTYMFATCFLLKRSAKFKLKILGGVIAALGMMLYLADDTFWERQSTISSVSKADGSEEPDAESDGGRMAIWMAAVDVAREHPLGLGAYGFTAISPQVLPPALLTGGVRSVHSTFLEAVTAYGYIGLLFFTAMIWRAFSSLLRTERQLRRNGNQYESLLGCALASGFFGYLVCSVFVTRLYAESTYFLVVFCALFATLYSRSPDAPPPQAAAPRKTTNGRQFRS
jgi:hypothetical protein